MATQTGSIDFKSTKGFQSYASGQYATLAQVKGQFATCSTAAATQAKAATIVPSDTGWELYTGATITVRFTADNTHATPTLNVNSTGAKSIRDHTGAALTEDAYKWKAGDALAFTYDGTYWRMQDTLAQRVTTNKTAIEQNARDITFRATKTEAAQMAQPNLVPWFSAGIPTLPSTYWKYGAGTGATAIQHTDMGDGWCHIVLDNSSGTSSIRYDYDPVAAEGIELGKDYTFLFELRNIGAASSTNTQIYSVQARTYGMQFWGNNAQKLLEGYGTNCTIALSTTLAQSGGNSAVLCDDGVYRKRVVRVSEASDSTYWTRSDDKRCVRLVTFCAAGDVFDAEFRFSIYQGEYTGPYKPYVGQQLYASQAELKVANDAISLRATKEEVEKTYSTKEDSQLDRSGSGTSVTVEGAANAALKGLHVIGESMQDGTPTPTAPIPIQNVGPINHIINGEGLVVSGLGSASGSRAEYKAANLGQSYMNIEHGTKVTISFDLYMTVNTANPTLNVYNTNNKGPKSFSSSASGSGTTGGVILSFTAAVGSVIDERVSVVGYINDRASGSISVQDNYIEFYSSYGSSNWFSVSNLQMEVDNPPHPFVSYDSIGLVVRGKNLLHTAAVSSVVNGVTFTVNSDGSVTANGTASALTQFGVNKFEEFFSHGDFVLSGCPSGGGSSTYDLRTSTAISGGASAIDTGNGVTFSRTTEENGVIVYITIRSGYACNNLTFYPQIERGDTATEYEPYRGTVTPIPLQGHELRSLPDGTRDELTVDADGHVTMTQRVGAYHMADYVNNPWSKSGSATNGYYMSYTYLEDSEKFVVNKAGNIYSNMASPATTTSEYFAGPNKTFVDSSLNFNLDGSVVGTTLAGFKSWLGSSNLMAYTNLATPQTIDLGTIDMPQVHDGDTVEVIAALTPSIDVTWWASAGQAVADAYASLSSAIEVRAESIVSTVSERYATSDAVDAIATQITQTATSWTAAFNQLRYGDDEEPTDDNKKLKMTLAQAFEALGVTSENLDELRSYVRIATDAQNKPYLLMGSEKSPIMMALTNDSLKFMHGQDPVAYIDVDGETNEGELHITRATIDNELRFGSKGLGSIWRWHVRANGNLALGWTSGAGDE